MYDIRAKQTQTEGNQRPGISEASIFAHPDVVSLHMGVKNQGP